MTNEAPVGIGNLWFSKRRTKGAVVVLVVRAFDYDCVCAHDAHFLGWIYGSKSNFTLYLWFNSEPSEIRFFLNTSVG